MNWMNWGWLVGLDTKFIDGGRDAIFYWNLFVLWECMEEASHDFLTLGLYLQKWIYHRWLIECEWQLNMAVCHLVGIHLNSSWTMYLSWLVVELLFHVVSFSLGWHVLHFTRQMDAWRLPLCSAANIAYIVQCSLWRFQTSTELNIIRFGWFNQQQMQRRPPKDKYIHTLPTWNWLVIPMPSAQIRDDYPQCSQTCWNNRHITLWRQLAPPSCFKRAWVASSRLRERVWKSVPGGWGRGVPRNAFFQGQTCFVLMPIGGSGWAWFECVQWTVAFPVSKHYMELYKKYAVTS